MYSAWKNGRSPPRVDWRRLYADISDKTSSQRARYNQLTDALRVLYEDRSISRENCKAWVEKYDELMPLLCACKKVQLIKDDARPMKGSSSSSGKYDVHEIVGCRKVISEIGKQKQRSNTQLKQINKDGTEREQELLKRLARINSVEPRDRESASNNFSARESYYGKLAKVRIEKVEYNLDVQRQNLEIDSAELALKERIAILEDRLRRR